MDWKKYNQVPVEFATASTIGLAAATLAAMARRGFVEIKDTKPKQYRRVESPAIRVYQLCEENKGDYETFFTLWKKDAPYGMFCSMDRSGDILDCWGNKYDLTDVVRIKFRTRSFDI